MDKMSRPEEDLSLIRGEISDSASIETRKKSIINNVSSKIETQPFRKNVSIRTKEIKSFIRKFSSPNKKECTERFNFFQEYVDLKIDNLDSILYEKIKNFYEDNAFHLNLIRLKNAFSQGKNSFELLMILSQEHWNFSFFDFFDINSTDYNMKLKKKMRRNNFLLKTLLKIYSIDPDYKIESIIKEFMLLNIDNKNQGDYGLYIEVDLFFLNIFDYKFFANPILRDNLSILHLVQNKIIKAQNIQELVNNLRSRISTEYHSIKFIKDEKFVIKMNFEEYLFVRDVIIGCIKRELYEGLEFILKIDGYSLIFKDEMIWELILIHLDPIKVYEFWKIYFTKINLDPKKYIMEITKNDYETGKNHVFTFEPNGNKNLTIMIDINIIRENIYNEYPVIDSFNSLLILMEKYYNRFRKFEKFNIEKQKILEKAFFFLDNENGCFVEINQQTFEISMNIEENLALELINKVIDMNNVKKEYMQKAIHLKFFKVAFTLSKYFICKEVLNEHEIQMALTYSLKQGEHAYYSICLLNTVNYGKIYSDLIPKIFKNLGLLCDRDNEILKMRHPLISFIIMAEFLQNLGVINMRYKYKCDSLKEIILNLAHSIQDQIKDEQALNYFLIIQTDHNKRNTLQIIAKNRFYIMLRNENVANLVSNLWYGNNKKVTFSKFCTIYRILFADLNFENFNDVSRSNYFELEKKTFYFQYEEYINNCFSRYIWESISTFFITFIFQVILYLRYNIFNNQVDAALNQKYQQFNNFGFFLIISANFQYIFDYIFFYKTQRQVPFDFFIIFDLLITILLILYNSGYITGFYTDQNDSQLDFIYSLIYSLIILCRWMKVLKILMETKIYGPFIRNIYLLITMMINFLTIYICTITLFSQIFYLLFSNYDTDFTGLFRSWVALFSASFSLYAFVNFNILDNFIFLGYAMYIIFITITNLMMLNLIVSIISECFIAFKSESDSENRTLLLKAYNRLKWDDQYGLLILVPTPFNLINILNSFVLFIFPESKRKEINSKISKILYFFILLIDIIVYIIISFIFFPFALLKSYIHSISDHIYDIKPQKKLLKNMVFSFFFRPYLLIQLIFNDLKIIFEYSYSPLVQIQKEESMINLKKKNFSKESLYLLCKYLENKKLNRVKFINFEEIIEELKIAKGLVKFSRKSSKLFVESVNSHNSLKSLKSKLGSTDTMNTKEDTFLLDLVKKLTDKMQMIDINLCLSLIPFRVNYSEHFIEGLLCVNFKQTLKGIKSFRFKINQDSTNNMLMIRKIGNFVNKILIKLKVVFNVVSHEYDKKSKYYPQSPH